MSTEQRRLVLLYCCAFLVLNTGYLLLHYIESGSWLLPAYHVKLLALLNLVWLSVSWWEKKYQLVSYKSFRHGLYVLAKSALFNLYFSSFVVVLLGITGFPRLYLFGSFSILLAAELLFLWCYLSRAGIPLAPADAGQRASIEPNFSIAQALADYGLFLLAVFLVHYMKYHTLALSGNGLKIFLILTGLWLVTGHWTGKFRDRFRRNIYYALSPFVKSAILMSLTMALLVYAFGLFHYSRAYIFGSILLFLVIELPVFLLNRLYQSESKQEPDIETKEEVLNIIRQERLVPGSRRKKPVTDPLQNKLKEKYLADNPELYEFIDKNIPAREIDAGDAQILSTHTFYNIRMLDNLSLEVFVNLHRVNDFRRINQYFLEVHKKLNNSGYFIGCKTTVDSYREQIFAKYPEYLARVVYFCGFVLHRVVPKMPILQKFYFAVWKGRNRVLSRAELFGRLHFCGFKVLDYKIIGNCLYYVAQKQKTPSLDRNPSYGPIIKLKRIGYQGQPIYINKLRTMHPYSEYLQDYVFEQNNLSENGKFKDDFRVTEWGRFFRKLWLDELPQLVNFIRGDLNLIGVRALSEQYFSLYPKDLQQLRIRFKPGLIPPYYADMPKSFNEIVESERRYLENKKQHPFRTDIEYFWRAWVNILFRHARSQ